MQTNVVSRQQLRKWESRQFDSPLANPSQTLSSRRLSGRRNLEEKPNPDLILFSSFPYLFFGSGEMRPHLFLWDRFGFLLSIPLNFKEKQNPEKYECSESSEWHFTAPKKKNRLLIVTWSRRESPPPSPPPSRCDGFTSHGTKHGNFPHGYFQPFFLFLSRFLAGSE